MDDHQRIAALQPSDQPMVNILLLTTDVDMLLSTTDHSTMGMNMNEKGGGELLEA